MAQDAVHGKHAKKWYPFANRIVFVKNDEKLIGIFNGNSTTVIKIKLAGIIFLKDMKESWN
jgi:hypothetical protein